MTDVTPVAAAAAAAALFTWQARVYLPCVCSLPAPLPRRKVECSPKRKHGCVCESSGAGLDPAPSKTADGSEIRNRPARGEKVPGRSLGKRASVNLIRLEVRIPFALRVFPFPSRWGGMPTMWSPALLNYAALARAGELLARAEAAAPLMS